MLSFLSDRSRCAFEETAQTSEGLRCLVQRPQPVTLMMHQMFPDSEHWMIFIIWLVVSNILHFHPENWGRFSNLTSIFFKWGGSTTKQSSFNHCFFFSGGRLNSDITVSEAGNCKLHRAMGANSLPLKMRQVLSLNYGCKLLEPVWRLVCLSFHDFFCT